MTSTSDRRAWDSAACLAHLLGETGRTEACQLVLDAAENGRVEIVISALVIAEVIALRGNAPIPSVQAEPVRRFFRREFFVVVDVDRFIASRPVNWFGSGV